MNFEDLAVQQVDRLKRTLWNIERCWMYAGNLKTTLWELAGNLRAEIDMLESTEEYKNFMKMRILDSSGSNDNGQK